jgi:hypothetical protein
MFVGNEKKRWTPWSTSVQKKVCKRSNFLYGITSQQLTFVSWRCIFRPSSERTQNQWKMTAFRHLMSGLMKPAGGSHWALFPRGTRESRICKLSGWSWSLIRNSCRSWSLSRKLNESLSQCQSRSFSWSRSWILLLFNSLNTKFVDKYIGSFKIHRWLLHKWRRYLFFNLREF